VKKHEKQLKTKVNIDKQKQFLYNPLKRNTCIRNNCIKCCIKTSMLLSNRDIEKIEQLGYDRHYFTKSKKGWLKLKNKDGKCVFHNGKVCIIYDNKPEGCILYPLIFDRENKSAVVDEDCPYENCFRFSKKDIKRLYNLITQITDERKNRRK